MAVRTGDAAESDAMVDEQILAPVAQEDAHDEEVCDEVPEEEVDDSRDEDVVVALVSPPVQSEPHILDGRRSR